MTSTKNSQYREKWIDCGNMEYTTKRRNLDGYQRLMTMTTYMNAAMLVMRQHILALATDTDIHNHHGDRALVIGCGRAFVAVMSVSKTTFQALDMSNDNTAHTDMELKNMIQQIARRNEFLLNWMKHGYGFLCPICRTLPDGEKAKKCKKPRLQVREWHTLYKHVGISHGWDVAENILGDCKRLCTRLLHWKGARLQREATTGFCSVRLEANLQATLTAMRQAGVLLGQDARQADEALDAVEGDRIIHAKAKDLMATARFLRLVPPSPR